MKLMNGLLLTFMLSFAPGLRADLSQWNSEAWNEDFACDAPRPYLRFEMTGEYRLSNAYLLLSAAALAESRDRETIASGIKDWGFTDLEFIGKPRFGAFGYFAEREELNLLSFRGTNSFREGLFNTFFLPSSFEPLGLAGAGHHGMMLHFKKLLRESEAILRRHDPGKAKPLFITGHSLGGAMALLHALHFAKDGWNVVAVYTSAQPHVGDEAFHQEVADWLPERYFRMARTDDPTPRVPPIASTREVFGQLVPFLSGPLEKLVGQMNYGASRTPYLEIGSRLTWQNGDPELLEAAFWNDLKYGLENPKSLPDLVKALQSRMQEHPPQNYMCAFLRALEGGSSIP
ncbi:MAG TPA: hypothetical protein VFO10_17655 [Oligoflexus sp.]|uniref:lipase family protein n=1 Tax=Oligoflexus sp. TaxID=1971216 RepID=UPI002D7F615C|nr:hypothetical protein [Oligoflexus sp.]HET9239089.1 hypothetical protein [Oligoflexus sp.]